MFKLASFVLFLSLFIVDVYAQDYADVFEYHGRKNIWTNGKHPRTGKPIPYRR